jgi:hypothetical protein
MSARRYGRRLFWFFFALYALTSSGNAFRVPDEFEVYFQAEHLVDAGDISVPQTLAIREAGAPILFGKFGADGRPYAPYGPGVAYLIAPFHVAGRLLARAAHVPRVPLPEGAAWEFVVGGVTTIAMAFAAALAVAGFYRASLALDAPQRQSVRLAAILGGGPTGRRCTRRRGWRHSLRGPRRSCWKRATAGETPVRASLRRPRYWPPRC